jgi:hypothetical protein
VFRYIHALSAVLFYLLGSSFFIAFILMRNGIAAENFNAWLHAGDMPLLLSGLLYGGLSVYGSIRSDTSSSKILLIGILVPLVIIFLLLAALNFGLLGR